MSSRPAVSAQVTFSTLQSDLILDRCTLTYTNFNWNTPQSLTFNPIYNVPGYMNSTNININYVVNFSGGGDSTAQQSSSIITSRKVDILQTKKGYCEGLNNIIYFSLIGMVMCTTFCFLKTITSHKVILITDRLNLKGKKQRWM